MATIKRSLTCLLTVEEMKSLGIELAGATQKKSRLEDDKKQSMSQFKAEIDAADAEINAISQKIASGKEVRIIDCEVKYHTPGEGMKTIIRKDTNETVEVVRMNDAELEDLFINGLGANREEGFFTFRNRKRLPLVVFTKFQEAQNKASFKKHFTGNENEMVDMKLESVDNRIVVDCESVFDLYECLTPEVFKEADADAEVIEEKLLPGGNENE